MWKVAPSYSHATIKTVDETTHKAYIVEKCDRCSGSGIFATFGTCFKCGGSGKIGKWVKAYTEEEYDKYIAQQEKARQKRVDSRLAKIQALKDNSQENKRELLISLGCDSPDAPLIYLIGGKNTYDIKDYLKECGCRFERALGWYSLKKIEVPEGYTLVMIPFDDAFDWECVSKRFFIKEEAKKIAEAALATLRPESHSEYVGEIKERLRDLKVTVTSCRTFDSYYGTSTVILFSCGENELVWMTSSPVEVSVGEEIYLTGTVKSHDEYNGVKQTKLTRCVIRK